MENEEKLFFASDYLKGAHPSIIKRLSDTNMDHTVGYGLDPICDGAKEKIRKACECPKAQVEFLVGGTQTNAVMIDAFLRPYQGVISANTGHIAGHEAGAIEAGGHKVLTIEHELGKITAESIKKYMEDYYGDANHDHVVMPGMVYISHPTEYGTLYTKKELEDLKEVCKKYDLPLYLDGARLAYALACPENDVTLSDLARTCDAFYIGGTKCGALFGEAVVVPDHERLPHLFTLIKQHGALLAKGRMLGIQFDELFTGDVYREIGAVAIKAAERIKKALREKNYQFFFETPTNQIFIVLDNERVKEIGEKVEYGFWEKYDDTHTVIRLCTDWGTTDEEVDALIALL